MKYEGTQSRLSRTPAFAYEHILRRASLWCIIAARWRRTRWNLRQILNLKPITLKQHFTKGAHYWVCMVYIYLHIYIYRYTSLSSSPPLFFHLAHTLIHSTLRRSGCVDCNPFTPVSFSTLQYSFVLFYSTFVLRVCFPWQCKDNVLHNSPLASKVILIVVQRRGWKQPKIV